MTKAELREKLLGGAVMDNLFAFRNGQDCQRYGRHCCDGAGTPDAEAIVGAI